MQATLGEFRNRFWIIGGIFFASFMIYWGDQKNLVEWLVRLAGFSGPDEVRGIRIGFGLGAAIIAAGAALRTWASAYLHTAVVQDRALHTSQVTADGPFRYVRNPLYLGTWLSAVGMGVLASRVGFLVLATTLAIFLLRLIGREETELLATAGDDYRRYREAVPRIIPTLRPKLPRSDAIARWGQAFAGESMIWAFAVAVLSVAITLQGRWFIILMMVAFASRGIAVMMFRPPKPS